MAKIPQPTQKVTASERKSHGDSWLFWGVINLRSNMAVAGLS